MWTIESDDVKEAIRINEEMAAMMYRINKKEKAPLRRPGGGGVSDTDLEVVNPATQERVTRTKNAKGIREAVDQLVAWAAIAPSHGDLRQLVNENQEFIRTLINRAQKERLAKHVSDREAKIASEARFSAAPPTASAVDAPKPTQEILTNELRSLFDVGGEAACVEVLRAFKVATLAELPENLWADALVAIRSAGVAHCAAQPR
jgi:hypothetical protein